MFRTLQTNFSQLPGNRQLDIAVGAFIGLIGILMRVMENYHLTQNIIWSVIGGIAVSVPFYFIVPRHFKDHIMAEVLEEQMGITHFQFLLAMTLFVAVFGYQAFAARLFFISQLPQGLPPMAIPLCSVLDLMLTMVLPGYFIVKVSFEELMQDATQQHRAKLIEMQMEVMTAQGEHAKERYKHATRQLTAKSQVLDAVVAKVKNTQMTGQEVALLVERTIALPDESSSRGTTGSSDTSRPALQPGMETLAKLLELPDNSPK